MSNDCVCGFLFKRRRRHGKSVGHWKERERRTRKLPSSFLPQEVFLILITIIIVQSIDDNHGLHLDPSSSMCVVTRVACVIPDRSGCDANRRAAIKGLKGEPRLAKLGKE